MPRVRGQLRVALRELPDQLAVELEFPGIPAVVIAQPDGAVVAQNAAARQLMGSGVRRPCWKVVGALEDAEGLPCAPGCVRELLLSGLDRPRHTPVRLKNLRHRLSCIPLPGLVVCMLRPDTCSPPEPWQRLTPREREVLRLLAEGETTTSGAQRLGLSESTVRTHVEHMRSKLGVNTRAALVALGFRLGFLD